MKILRSIIALLLTAVFLLSAVGCGYSPVKSSKEERATVITLDGGFEVSYELYRFYFLSKLSLAEIDPATLDDAGKKAIFAEIHGKTLDEIASVYAVLKLAREYGIDTESRECDKYVKKNVIAAISGDEEYVGYGNRKTYLSEIKNAYMNDSVFRFLLRYRYAEEKLGEALRDADVLKSDKESVLAYMNGDECVRVSWIFIPYANLSGYTQEKLNQIEKDAPTLSDGDFFKQAYNTFTDYYSEVKPEEIYLGRYQLDPYYDVLTETAFSLEVGETTSSWIDSGDGMYIVRRLEKDQAYLADTENLSVFTEYYLLDSFYKILKAEADKLATTVSTNDLFGTLTLDNIKMPD